MIICVLNGWFGFTTILLWLLCFRESAMALNSLYPDGWFALGAAALKVTYVICIVLNSLFKGFFLPLNSSIYQKLLNHLLNNCYRLEMFRRLWMDLLVLFNLILITGRLGTILLVCMHPLLWVILHHFHPEIYCLLFSHLSTVLISFIELLHKISYFNQTAFFFFFWKLSLVFW